MGIEEEKGWWKFQGQLGSHNKSKSPFFENSIFRYTRHMLTSKK